MSAPDFKKQFEERIIPQLKELGVEGFSIVGYMTDGDGRMGRFALAQASNPAVSDGLQKMICLSAMWSAPAQEFGAPLPGPNIPSPNRANPPE